jgi:hypothetical protein
MFQGFKRYFEQLNKLFLNVKIVCLCNIQYDIMARQPTSDELHP